MVQASLEFPLDYCRKYTTDRFIRDQWPAPSRDTCEDSLRSEPSMRVGIDFEVTQESDAESTISVRVRWVEVGQDDAIFTLVEQDSSWLIDDVNGQHTRDEKAG